ncbi:hypothetical protein [Novosphingobium sp. Gsoil 351]|uniref:hypothetical protein n=1 Tax=Novosphingobium sp. Gsoil 351 TaxID=2675225 RepID=UPI0012B4CC0F|nr:hypothetical protein [Novosphingobium sp. Gsoil 351]QGN55469.1 hypothetical protein GKE62_13840 [Novosphingobium sp. Gsoil 351]
MGSFVLSITGPASLQMVLRVLDMVALFGIDPEGIELERDEDCYILTIAGTTSSSERLSALTAKLMSIVVVTDVVQRGAQLQPCG